MPSWQCKSLQLGHKSFNAIGPCILFTLDNGDTTVSVVVKLRNVIGVSSFDELREVVVDERRVEAWRLPAVGVVRDVGVENFGDSIAGAIGHRRVTDAKVDADDVAAHDDDDDDNHEDVDGWLMMVLMIDADGDDDDIDDDDE